MEQKERNADGTLCPLSFNLHYLSTGVLYTITLPLIHKDNGFSYNSQNLVKSLIFSIDREGREAQGCRMGFESWSLSFLYHIKFPFV